MSRPASSTACRARWWSTACLMTSSHSITWQRRSAVTSQPCDLASRGGSSMLDDLEYLLFQRTVRRLIGVDLASYRQGQMRRRLDALVQRVGAQGYGEYARMLERDPVRVQEFRDYF